MGKHKIWFDDYKNLINEDNFFTIVPTKNMSLNKKINTLTRFLLYFGIISFLLKGNYLYLYIPFGFISLTYFMHICSNEKKENFKENNLNTEKFSENKKQEQNTKAETEDESESETETETTTQNNEKEYLDVSNLIKQDFSNRHIVPRKKFQDFGSLAKFASGGKILSRKLIV